MEISILLASKSAALTDFCGRHIGNGQPRCAVDVTLAEQQFGFRAKTFFDEALLRTITWYRATRGDIAAGRKVSVAG